MRIDLWPGTKYFADYAEDITNGESETAMLLGTKAHEHKIFVIGGSFPGHFPFSCPFASLRLSHTLPTLFLLWSLAGGQRQNFSLSTIQPRVWLLWPRDSASSHVTLEDAESIVT